VASPSRLAIMLRRTAGWPTATGRSAYTTAGSTGSAARGSNWRMQRGRDTIEAILHLKVREHIQPEGEMVSGHTVAFSGLSGLICHTFGTLSPLNAGWSARFTAQAGRLLTHDRGFYRSYFPDLSPSSPPPADRAATASREGAPPEERSMVETGHHRRRPIARTRPFSVEARRGGDVDRSVLTVPDHSPLL
jgi:hypothetical protein